MNSFSLKNLDMKMITMICGVPSLAASLVFPSPKTIETKVSTEVGLDCLTAKENHLIGGFEIMFFSQRMYTYIT